MSVRIATLLQRDSEQAEWYRLEDRALVRAYNENGRLYHNYNPGTYPFPCDEPERKRMEVIHHMVYSILLYRSNEPLLNARGIENSYVGSIRTAPVLDIDPTKIIDLGCGNGNWALDIADVLPNAQIDAIDISDTRQDFSVDQVQWITPSSCPQRWFDLNSKAWVAQANTYDLVHASQLCGSIRNWRAFAENCFRITQPGGCFESIEVDYEPRCDDGTVPDDSVLNIWWTHLREATREKPIEYPKLLPTMLQEAGWKDVQCLTLPLPIGEWSYHADAAWVANMRSMLCRYNECGNLVLPAEAYIHNGMRRVDWKERIHVASMWMKDSLADMFSDAPTLGFQGLTLGPFSRNLHWTKARIDDICGRLVERICAKHLGTSQHLYFRLHIVVARKP